MSDRSRTTSLEGFGFRGQRSVSTASIDQTTRNEITWDFKTSITTANQLIDAGFSFSRSGTARYLSDSGVLLTGATNEPRFEYLISRNENYLPFSNNLDWANTGSTRKWDSLWSLEYTHSDLFIDADPDLGILAPDGTNTAKFFSAPAGITSIYGILKFTLSSAIGTTRSRTFSIWLRSYPGIPSDYLFSYQSNPSASQTNFTLLRGSGWTRFTFTTTDNHQPVLWFKGTTMGAENPAYFFVWGAQLNDGDEAKTNVTTTAVNPVVVDTPIPAGLLLEGAATNILYQTDALGTSQTPGWNTRSNLNTSVSWTGLTAPDGSSTAVKLIPNTTNDSHYLGTTGVSLTSGKTYTFSVYAKANGYSFVGLVVTTSNNGARFNVADGGSNQSDSGFSSLEYVGGGWYRVQTTWTQPSTTSTAAARVIVLNQDDNPSTSWAGDNTNSILVWGPQLEEGTGASSYVSSTSTQGTRVRDVLSYSNLQTLWGNSTAQRSVIVDLQWKNHVTTNSPFVVLRSSSGDDERIYGSDFGSGSFLQDLVHSGTYVDSSKSWSWSLGGSGLAVPSGINYEPTAYSLSVALGVSQGVARITRGGQGADRVTDAAKIPASVSFNQMFVGPGSYSNSNKGSIRVSKLSLFSYLLTQGTFDSLTADPSGLPS